ncbi:MAG: hypothetical protein BGO41_11565 [Clostridiales bacterium 38-18]|nr:MAG: hypothetical protein BGO41_11565 [Clostridiales bacterium 38-18]
MYIKAKGRQLIHPETGEPIRLIGFNFTQNYWMPNEVILQTGVDDSAYKYASELGANSVRLLIRHSFFEPFETPFTYDTTALNWLDLQIKHAKQNGLLVTLALVLPHGGDWLDKEDGKDFRFWYDEALQKRFIEIWQVFAERYKDEEALLGYDLFNVPVTNDRSGQSYYDLLDKTIEQIRLIDENHLIVVSKLYGCHGIGDDLDSPKYYKKVNWENIIYDYHFYDPNDYTHQYAGWIGNNSDGGSYPDESILEPVEEGVSLPRNIDYLRKRLNHILQFGRENDVPVHIGEIGLTHPCYHHKGALNWIKDVKAILSEDNVGYYYWDFQSEAMGLIMQKAEEEIDPSKINLGLAENLFR